MKLRFVLFAVSIVPWISINSTFANESPSSLPEAAGPVIEEVIVTGSLLPRGDFVSKAPISTISSTQFEMSNSVNVESLINSMPQVVGGADRSSTFGQGIATANLRGLGENLPLLALDREQMGRVLSNLIVNAEMATRQSGRKGVICFSTRLNKNGREVRLEVSDNGVGIPKNLKLKSP